MCIKSCSIIGHREINEEDKNLEQKLKEVFVDLIANGTLIFYFTASSDFDMLCYEVVSELKETYPDIKKVFVFDDYKYIDRPHKRPKWLDGLKYDEFEYFTLHFDWWYQRLYYRNLAIIEHSDICLFYIRNTQNSGAYKAFQYAKKCKKEIINV